MKRVLAAVFLIYIFISCLSAQCLAVDSYEGSFTYIIGPGDELEIKVWRHPDLTTEVRVRPDGKISFPLINEIFAANLTPEQLKQKIARDISNTIRDPNIIVNVKSFKSKKIFVLGEVNIPGVYPYEGRATVLEAISKAAGYKKDTAALKSVIIISRGYTSKPEAKRVNVWDIIHSAKVENDIVLDAGDVVFVPTTFIADVNTFIDQFFTKTDPVLKYYLDIIDIDQRTPAGRSR
ncbi:MAG: polysaccharide biosynthesis/export family protein [Candidatus Omnitrophota bacterium]